MDDCLQLHCHADKPRLLWRQVKTYRISMYQPQNISLHRPSPGSTIFDSWQRQDDKTEDSSYLIRRSRSHSSSWDRLICGMSSVLPPGKTKQTGTLSFPHTAQQVVSTVNTVNTSTYCSTVRLLMRDFCDERRHQFFSDPFFQNLSPSYFHVNQP